MSLDTQALVSRFYESGWKDSGDGTAEELIALSESFPDLKIRPTDTIIDHEGATTWARVTGTDTAGYLAMPPSGLGIDVAATFLDRVVDGRIVAHRGLVDELAILRQIHAIPSTWTGDRLLGSRQSEPAASSPTSGSPTLYEWAGGMPAITRVFEIFYRDHVPGDDLLGPLFEGMDPNHAGHVAAWIAETLGGPTLYTDHHGGYPNMLGHHLGLELTEAHRGRWVALLGRAIDEAGLPADPEFRAALTAYVEWGTRIALENSQPGADPPREAPIPRWGWGVAPPWEGS